MQQKPASMSARDFSFAADDGTSCPRKGRALIAFATSSKDNIHYSLDCTNGHFSGVAMPVPKPGGGYVAPAVANFDIGATTQVNCVLKSVAPGAPKVHTMKGHKYQCVKRTGVDASGDLTPDTRPDPQKPDKPGKAVVDFPRKTDTPKPDRDKDSANKDGADKGKMASLNRLLGRQSEGRRLRLPAHR